MASEVQICNLALTRLGHKSDPLASLADTGKAARLCALHYEPTRDAVLRAHPWNFAVKRAELPALEAAPVWGHARAFQLPADLLRVLELEDSGAEYRVEGRTIATDAGAPLRLEYLARVTDPGLFDALFIDALAARLAAELAVPLTDNAQLAETMSALYQAKLAEARTTDAMEGTPRGLDADAWLNARF